MRTIVARSPLQVLSTPCYRAALYPAAVNELGDELGEALLVVLGAPLSQRAVEGVAQVEEPGERRGEPGARGSPGLHDLPK